MVHLNLLTGDLGLTLAKSTYGENNELFTNKNQIAGF